MVAYVSSAYTGLYATSDRICLNSEGVIKQCWRNARVSTTMVEIVKEISSIDSERKMKKKEKGTEEGNIKEPRNTSLV